MIYAFFYDHVVTYVTYRNNFCYHIKKESVLGYSKELGLSD